MIDPKLLELLACPVCPERPPLEERDGWLVCMSCGRRFPIRDGIPDLLPESAVEPQEGSTEP